MKPRGTNRKTAFCKLIVSQDEANISPRDLFNTLLSCILAVFFLVAKKKRAKLQDNRVLNKSLGLILASSWPTISLLKAVFLLVPLGFILASSWLHLGLILGSSWAPLGLLLGSSWALLGLLISLLEGSWAPLGLILGSSWICIPKTTTTKQNTT